MKTRLVFPLGLLIVILVAASLLLLRHLEDITYSSPAFAEAADTLADDQRPVVRIGVISRFAPNVIFAGYQPIMDYLSRHGTHRYELTLSTSYLDAVERLDAGEVTASFLGAWIFGHLEAGSGLAPLVAPLNAQGRSDFHAVLVTGPDSSLDSLADLRGRRVALPSAQSWSGNWLQSSGLGQVGLTSADLDTIRHFDHHQTVVWKVLRGDFDAGVVKESVAAAYRREGLREIGRSGPIPGPPLACSDNGPRDVLEEVRGLLLALDPDVPSDRAVLSSWSPEFAHGFTTVDPERYRDAFRDVEASSPEAPR